MLPWPVCIAPVLGNSLGWLIKFVGVQVSRGVDKDIIPVILLESGEELPQVAQSLNTASLTVLPLQVNCSGEKAQL